MEKLKRKIKTKHSILSDETVMSGFINELVDKVNELIDEIEQLKNGKSNRIF